MLVLPGNNKIAGSPASGLFGAMASGDVNILFCVFLRAANYFIRIP